MGMGNPGSTKDSTMARGSRNKELIPGVNRLGRSAAASKFGRYKHFGKTAKKVEAKPAEASTKQPRWYAADDVKKPLSSRKNRHKPTKLRASITPGTVLILLAGRFKGKRVVFLKQLDSGLLLISGPYKINGVPLRRVNQVYVIATSTKVDVSKVDVSKIDDSFFPKEKAAKAQKDGDEFFKSEDKKAALSQEKKDAQKAVDTRLIASISKVANMQKYLNAKFSLTPKDRPHEMKF